MDTSSCTTVPYQYWLAGALAVVPGESLEGELSEYIDAEGGPPGVCRLKLSVTASASDDASAECPACAFAFTLAVVSTEYGCGEWYQGFFVLETVEGLGYRDGEGGPELVAKRRGATSWGPLGAPALSSVTFDGSNLLFETTKGDGYISCE